MTGKVLSLSLYVVFQNTDNMYLSEFSATWIWYCLARGALL